MKTRPEAASRISRMVFAPAGVPPVGGSGRQGDRVPPRRPADRPRQAVCHVLVRGSRPRAAPREPGVGRSLPRPFRPGVGPAPRGDAGAAEGARDRVADGRVRAPGPLGDEEAKPAVAWERCRPTEQRLCARQMEVYAGFVFHVDHQIGRLIDSLAASRAARRHADLPGVRQRRERRGAGSARSTSSCSSTARPSGRRMRWRSSTSGVGRTTQAMASRILSGAQDEGGLYGPEITARASIRTFP